MFNHEIIITRPDTFLFYIRLAIVGVYLRAARVLLLVHFYIRSGSPREARSSLPTQGKGNIWFLLLVAPITLWEEAM